MNVLCFNGAYITEEAADSIADVISRNANLEKLLLQSNFFKDKGIIKIARAIKDYHSLKVLDLEDNDITEDALDSLFEVIANNPLLEIVRFVSDSLDDNGILKMICALKPLHGLKRLDLHHKRVLNRILQSTLQRSSLIILNYKQWF